MFFAKFSAAYLNRIPSNPFRNSIELLSLLLAINWGKIRLKSSKSGSVTELQSGRTSAGETRRNDISRDFDGNYLNGISSDLPEIFTDMFSLTSSIQRTIIWMDSTEPESHKTAEKDSPWLRNVNENWRQFVQQMEVDSELPAWVKTVSAAAAAAAAASEIHGCRLCRALSEVAAAADGCGGDAGRLDAAEEADPSCGTAEAERTGAVDEALDDGGGPVGGPVNSVLDMASAWIDNMSRLAACLSASRSSAVWRLFQNSNESFH